MKFLSISFVVIGVNLILFSGYYGIQFGTTEGPLVQGYAGGLIPTVTALVGLISLNLGWNNLVLLRDLEMISRMADGR
jgi:hypothetical protein